MRRIVRGLFLIVIIVAGLAALVPATKALATRVVFSEAGYDSPDNGAISLDVQDGVNWPEENIHLVLAPEASELLCVGSYRVKFSSVTTPALEDEWTSAAQGSQDQAMTFLFVRDNPPLQDALVEEGESYYCSDPTFVRRGYPSAQSVRIDLQPTSPDSIGPAASPAAEKPSPGCLSRQAKPAS